MNITDYELFLNGPTCQEIILIYRGNENIIIRQISSDPDIEKIDILVPRKILESFIDLIR
jgi:hypothetical protein